MTFFICEFVRKDLSMLVGAMAALADCLPVRAWYNCLVTVYLFEYADTQVKWSKCGSPNAARGESPKGDMIYRSCA